MQIKLSSITGSSQADLFIIGVFEEDKTFKTVSSVEKKLGATLLNAKKAKRFMGKAGTSFDQFDNLKHSREAIVLGLGSKKAMKKSTLKKIAASVYRGAASRGAKKIKIDLESFVGGDVKVRDVAEVFSEMPQLTLYKFEAYFKKAKGTRWTDSLPRLVELVYRKKSSVIGLAKVVDRAKKTADAVVYARDLNNHPGNVMNPPRLAAESRKLARAKKLKCKIYNTPELKKMKMGGILGVNQGSITPPHLIVLEHGLQHKKKGTVCIVGKGVTFDTGGISLKPGRNMDEMKYDMSGAIAVIGTMKLVADLKLPLHVVGLMPTVENNIAKDPIRPGDILHMHNGKTVEVLNTDAEGRLILADALHFSGRFKPDAIIDAATLTGMCVATFGDKTAAVLGNDQKLIDKIKKAADKSDERVWQLPLWDDYLDQLKGHHSDLYNIGGPYGGTITAAKFLEQFIPSPKTSWAHLDIAGTAWNSGPKYNCPKGATGFGVKLFGQLLSDWKK